jgi:hypothetical protein
VTSLDKIQEQLDRIEQAQSVLLAAIHELGVKQDGGLGEVRKLLAEGIGEFWKEMRAKLEDHGTRLAAIFGKLCAQQEARRGKAVRGDRNKKFGRG